MPANATAADPLSAFEPGIRDWFVDAFARPTAIQAAAWPVIAAGEHVLATAPTGSGKTLTAFLWALNQFAAGRWDTGATRVLYVSPLKALNNDIQRNLLAPLEALANRGALPALRVHTRSGDTPSSERQRMLRKPPEILITTPESLNLLLTGARGRQVLATVETVIVDEVHALADNRRGTLLLTALERLVQLAGEVQRIALSATVRPLDAIAEHVAGRDPAGRPRRMRVLDAGGDKAIALAVRFPPAARDAADSGTRIWSALADGFRDIIAGNTSTLFFVNSRQLAERLTWAINRDQPAPLAYAHHGSLSREIRLEVESRLKAGELKAIVATSSLEMGIDIGSLDEVVMIQSPPTVAATLQRLGRAGHRVGEESRGTLFPTFAQDFVAAAALADAVAARDIEPLKPLENPLDVLCQIIVSLTASETWAVDDIFDLLRRSGAYRRLPREHFDLVVEMLAGRYEGSRVRELKARVAYDRIRGTVRALHSAVLAYYNAGGVIPDRGYYQLRHLDSGTVLGELDEEFVWEARVGQVFTLGTQSWQVHRITHNDVVVRPAAGGADAPPFWRAETRRRSFHYARRIGDFLQRAEELLATDQAEVLGATLQRDHGFDAVAAEVLSDYLLRQRQATGRALPHGRHLLLERVRTAPGGHRGAEPLEQLVIHTGWGGQVNKPFSLALAAALAGEMAGVDCHADDNVVALLSAEPLDPARVLRLVNAGNLDALLRRSLESSGLFGARFREAAGRALLLTRQRFNARLPLWLSRLQAKKLMGSVRRFGDFPVMLEAWRACLEDEFDLPALRACLGELEDGVIAVSRCTTSTPSPFAADAAFAQINPYMYGTDKPDGSAVSALADDLIRSAVRDAALRPRVAADTVVEFEAKRQRTAPGYVPESAADWAEWVKERVLLPATELPAGVEHRDLTTVVQGERRWVVHRELLHVLIGSGLLGDAEVPGDVPAVADPRDARQLALETLSFYGPLTAAAIRALLPTLPDGLLDDPETLIRGPLLEDDARIHYCDPDNFESLLRIQRARRRPQITTRPAQTLPAWLAAWQGLGPGDSTAGGRAAETWLEPLRGFAAPVSVWLDDLPAARNPGAGPAELERTWSELELAWQGAGSGRIRIGYPEDLALLGTVVDSDPAAEPEAAGGTAAAGPAGATVADAFADPRARYGFLQLADADGASLTDFNQRFWTAVWQGRVAADSLAPLRQGVARNFKLGDAVRPRVSTRGRRFPGSAFRPTATPGAEPPSATAAEPRPAGYRAPRYGRSRLADPWSGTWYLTEAPAPAEDALDDLEDTKERARMLLDRYGVLCRELANREGGVLRWSALFRALRLMELAGEVLAGHFFDGLSGPQFALPDALPLLQDRDAEPATFWCNALDPASPCGLGLDWGALPQRRPQNYLAFRAGELALVVENLGKRLTFHIGAADVDDELLAPVRRLLAAHRRLTLEEINGAPARTSPYRPALERLGRLVSDHRATWLEAAQPG